MKQKCQPWYKTYQEYIVYYFVSIQPLQGAFILFLIDYINKTDKKINNDDDENLIEMASSSIQSNEQLIDQNDILLSSDIGVL